MTKVLYIDNRERLCLVVRPRSIVMLHGFLYVINQNMITDYAFASVGIEAKSISDYMSSLYSGHFGEALQNLDDNYNQFALVVGVARPIHNEGEEGVV